MRGEIFEVERCTDIYYVDTGMFDVSEYGSVYLIDAERPALVDTGTGANYDNVLKLLEEVGVDRTELAKILLTHVHLDHAGGAGFIAEACPNAEVYVHEIGSQHLVDPSGLIGGTKRAVGSQWKHYATPKAISKDRIVELTDGDTIDLGNRTLDVHHVPGHAPHQVLFYDGCDDAVFSADAAGAWIPANETVYTPSPPPNFDLEQVIEDAELIADLDPQVLLFAHFGPGPTDVQGVLDDFRAAVEEWVTAVKRKHEEFSDEAAVADYFASQSAVRDVWGRERAEADAAMNVRGVLRYLENRDG